MKSAEWLCHQRTINQATAHSKQMLSSSRTLASRLVAHLASRHVGCPVALLSSSAPDRPPVPEVGVQGDMHRSPSRASSHVRVPEDKRDWGGVHRTQSVVEQRFSEIRRSREEQLHAASEIEDGVLLYENANRLRPLLGSLSFTVPWVAGSYLAYAKVTGDLPLDAAPWLLIGALFVAGGVARSASRSASELTAHRVWLTNGGRDIRVQTFKHWFWGVGPLVKYPAAAVIEHVPSGPSDAGLKSKLRLLHLKGDSGPYLVMYRDAKTPHPDLLELLMRGEAGMTPQEAEHKEAEAAATDAQAKEFEALRASGEWKEAVDDRGRKYFWHTATRETKWTRPKDE
jgi:hypothetical protein